MKKFLLSLAVMVFTFTSMQAMVLSNKSKANNQQESALNMSTPYDMLTSVSNQLKTKAQSEELSGFEARLLKKADRKIQKWDKKNERLISQGKAPAGGKSWTVALILCILIGGLGIHRFYLGYTWQGVVQLLTLGGLGVWTLIDLIRIITRDLQPKNGRYTD